MKIRYQSHKSFHSLFESHSYGRFRVGMDFFWNISKNRQKKTKKNRVIKQLNIGKCMLMIYQSGDYYNVLFLVKPLYRAYSNTVIIKLFFTNEPEAGRNSSHIWPPVQRNRHQDTCSCWWMSSASSLVRSWTSHTLIFNWETITNIKDTFSIQLDYIHE